MLTDVTSESTLGLWLVVEIFDVWLFVAAVHAGTFSTSTVGPSWFLASLYLTFLCRVFAGCHSAHTVEATVYFSDVVP